MEPSRILGAQDCNLAVWREKRAKVRPPMLSAAWGEDKGGLEGKKKYHIDHTSAKINFLWRRQCLHPSKTTRGPIKYLRVSTIQPPGTNSNVHKFGTNCESQYHPTRKLRNTKTASALKIPQTKVTLVQTETIKCKNMLPSIWGGKKKKKRALLSPPNLQRLVCTQR